MANAGFGPVPTAPEKLYLPGSDYPYLFRVLHWLLAPSLVVLAATGLSQHAVSSPQWSLFGGVLPPWCWPGQVNLIHLAAALVFAPAILAAWWVYCRGRVMFRMTHFVLLVGGAAMVVSGLLLSGWPIPPQVYQGDFDLLEMARWVHAITGLVVLPIAFVWHALTGLTRYRRVLLPSFRIWCLPRLLPLLCLVPLAAATSCLILNGLPRPAPWRDLTAKWIEPTEVSTEKLDSLPWDTARPLRIDVTNGMGFVRGRTEVTLRALHDGRELFVLAEWDDPAEDRQYMPWERTESGWRQLVTNPDDESTYYEDKFSLYFPAEPDWQFERFGCAVYCHAGGGRAYGYKGSQRTVDEWHWKATRTDPVGQVDDKYLGTIDLSLKDVGRYGDPKQSGGYENNVSDDKKHPKFLPQGPSAVKQGLILADRTVPYSEAAAAGVAPGVIVPGIVASPAVGDRGDVACTSRWDNGRWHLYVRRRLDTGSPYDTRFEPATAYPFGCAAFDRTSKRHAYNHAVYRLILEPSLSRTAGGTRSGSAQQ